MLERAQMEIEELLATLGGQISDNVHAVDLPGEWAIVFDVARLAGTKWRRERIKIKFPSWAEREGWLEEIKVRFGLR